MNAAPTKTQILDKEATRRKLLRMALQLAEQNTGASKIVLAGIAGNGEVVAHALAAALHTEAAVTTEVLTVRLNKKNPDEVTLHPALPGDSAVVVLVDDVANTGRTMFYALKPFLAVPLQKLQTAVLVERSHKLFPIQTDFYGLSLATTLQEHIEVRTEGGEVEGAWLY